MLNTLNDINYSFNQTVEEIKLESLVNVHSKVTDSFSTNEMMIESLRDEYSKTIGSFADMQLETKTATEMMIESLRDDYYSMAIETKATDSLLNAMQIADSFTDLERINSQAVSIHEMQLSDLSYVTPFTENQSLELAERTLKVQKDKLSSMVEELKNPFGINSIIEEESIFEKFKKQQSMYSDLVGLDAITQNALQSKIAGFNDEVNQLESLAVSSMQTMVSKAESGLELFFKQQSIDELGYLDSSVNTQHNYISEITESLAKLALYEQKSEADNCKEFAELFTTATQVYNNTKLDDILDPFNTNAFLEQLTQHPTDDITIKESAINYIRNIVLYVEDFLNLVKRELNRKLKSFISELTDIKASIKIFIESITLISPSSQYTHFLENLLKQHFYYKLNTSRP